MRKIIASKFELDLSGFKLVDTEQNSNMADTMFAKISYPFEIDLTDELNVSLDFIREYTTRPETIYDVFYVHFDKMEKGTLELEEISDNKLSCVLTYGLEQFPSWDKKLSELSLDKFELQNNLTIYQHAQAIIGQTWPTANYNFPQVHTDKIDTDDDVWFAFEKIINNRKDGAFLVNDVDLVEEITYNRNIMQPMPYLFHILEKGVQDAGFNLTGDILLDQKLKKQVVYADVSYYTTVEQNSVPIMIMSEEHIETGFVTTTYNPFIMSNDSWNITFAWSKFKKTIQIDNPGKYRIVGQVTMFMIPNVFCRLVIKYRNTIILQWGNSANYSGKLNLSINAVFETLADILPNEITVEIYQRKTSEQMIVQLDVNPIRLHDNSGQAIATVINKNEIDLTRAVPDMTFGDLIKILKNWFNYSFDVVDTNVVMNLIKKATPGNTIVNLERFEVKRVLRKFQKGMSFLLKFADVDSKEFVFLPVFQSVSGVVNTNYITNDKTNSIEINGLPLPLFTRNSVQTAYGFENSNSKLYLVKYDGLFGGNNLAQDNSELLLPAVHESNWLDWMNFRINAISYKMIFKAAAIDISNLNVKSEIYSYQNNHLIKSLQRTEISPDIMEVELETET